MGKHQPAILGGLFIGVMSSIPIISSANICCCLWGVTGGILVVYLQQQNRPEPVETADAVLGGLIAGLIGALIASAVTLAMVGMVGSLGFESIRSQIESNPDLPPEARDFLVNFLTGRGIMFVIFAINLPLYAVFTMLGALLGLAFFRKKLPPQASV